MASNTTTPKTYKAMNVSDRSDASGNELFHGTVRRDTVEKILRNGWVDGSVCKGRYTDDYKRDAARNFEKGSVAPESVLDSMETTPPERCWVALLDDGRQVITVYWSWQSYEVEIDTRAVRFEFGADDEDDDAEEVEDAQTPAEVFESLREGDKVLWDGKSQPLTVTVDYEDAKERIEEYDHIDTPEVWVEGPRGGEKQLRQADDADTITVATFSASSGRPEVIDGLRVVERAAE